MKFTPWKCPHCGDAADAVLETVQAYALLTRPAETGEWEYADDTEICWDTQVMAVDGREQVTLRCPEGHTWSARRDAGPDAEPAIGDRPQDLYRHLLDTAQEALREFLEERADTEDLAQMVSQYVDRDHAISVDESPAYFQGERWEGREPVLDPPTP